MSEGVLGKYARRETGGKPGPETVHPSGKRTYLAHEGKDKQIYLKLHPYKSKSCAPDYKHLFYYEYDEGFFETLVLEFGFIEVLIRGKHLEPIITSIDNHTCRYIREFHPGAHEHPGEGQPIVTQMVIRNVGLPKPEQGSEPDADGKA